MTQNFAPQIGLSESNNGVKVPEWLLQYTTADWAEGLLGVALVGLLDDRLALV